MNKRVGKILRSLDVRIAHISKERDRLRDLEDDIAEIRECCDTAIMDLELAKQHIDNAADELSKYL